MISNTDDTIDSRDVIERIEELEAELTTTFEEQRSNDLTQAEDFDEWLDDVRTNANMEDAFELYELKELQAQAEDSPDWNHGETLINESYFTDYIEELINDCYDLPKELNSGNWPWRHLTIDYEAAANEAKTDYMEVDFDGVTFLIRA